MQFPVARASDGFIDIVAQEVVRTYTKFLRRPNEANYVLDIKSRIA